VLSGVGSKKSKLLEPGIMGFAGKKGPISFRGKDHVSKREGEERGAAVHGGRKGAFRGTQRLSVPWEEKTPQQVSEKVPCHGEDVRGRVSWESGLRSDPLYDSVSTWPV